MPIIKWAHRTRRAFSLVCRFASLGARTCRLTSAGSPESAGMAGLPDRPGSRLAPPRGGQLSDKRRLRFPLALRQEAFLRRAGQGFAVLIDGLGFARFAPA